MFAALFTLTLFVALFQRVFAGLSIDTPQFTQCQPAEITWNGGNSPYNLIIVSADDVCGNALEDLGDFATLSTTFTVNLASGTQVVLSLEDASGDEAWTGTVTVGASSDSSCLSSNPSGLPTTTPTPTPTPSTTSSVPTTTIYDPAGAANAGLAPASGGALAVRPFSAVTALSVLVAGVFVSAL
ncbi:hypothetical protein SCLCIDRAFT_21080 [Scleroderma citrinum Foug A]|uniref:Uncharacterized protein n=1 Tax=Scleroderma citrinum Foug A TaxID=1036808 RepID=A0A0C3A1M7_9AGAM|nr:hypothetical protein SCLCIDRAFT_21080 [Scleroderma citrinum Foug A]